MGKKTKLPFFPKYTNGEKPKPSSWPWPSCHQPRTHSFRTDETPESWFSNSSESPSFSTASDESATGAAVDTVETVIQGLRLRSERLFFEPSEAKLGTYITESVDSAPFKETTVLSMESLNPLVDFRESMEEMVEAQGLKDRESLEELLGWYLKANGKSSHGYILGAFVGLLLKKVAVSSSSPCSPLSFYTSSSSFYLKILRLLKLPVSLR
ncbi:putative Ovate family protein [Hibiscus syriacus]|uniref:Transcription repressor n=1 Tax=Hibiscus syriacus TaxID=106335 RepID=A0A6A2WSL8_HIBSY|nr:putative Ovate family protein [Hibiscus syriacus]